MQTEANAAPQPSIAQIAADPAALANLTDDQIEALAGSSDPIPDNQGENTGSEPPVAASQPQAVGTGADAPKGVQAKDGEHIIPYSVLEREREARTRAEAMLQAQAAELERLAAGGKPAGEGQGDAVQFSEEDLTQLDQDLPGVAKVIRAQQATIDKLMGTVQTLQQEHVVEQTVKQEAAKDSIEAAIEANQDLRAWREDPTMWNRAADLDGVLREDPAWKDRPVAERFAKVAETVKALYGAPATPQPAASPQQNTQQALTAKADAAIAAADKAANVPRSLGDIPGGVPPAVDEASAWLEKTPTQMQADMLRLTPEQSEALLDRLSRSM